MIIEVYHVVVYRSGSYEIREAEGVSRGTKIIIHLKTESREFSDEQTVKDVIQKYSNFVGSPIHVNGSQINTIQVNFMLLETPPEYQ